jgi:diguanylate cyclase (GGDEF)-like protein
MARFSSLSSARALVGIGIEALPWIGLAVTSALFPTSFLPAPGPYPHLVLPLLILVGGALFIVGRRHWELPLVFTDGPAPNASASRRTGPSTPTFPPSNPPSHSEANRDPLTGLADRTRLLSKLSDSLQQAATEEEEAPCPALFTLRTNEYRDVTESFGHQAGQELLTAVANRIVDVPPSTASAARIAEDTFAVLLPATAEEEVQAVAERLMENFETPFDIATHQFPIEVSIGLAVRPSPDRVFESAEKMLQASYSAMHRVQRRGDDQLNVYQNGNQDETQWLLRRERLRQAIRDDELTLHYQPIVHLVSGERVGAEALVRWDHPKRGLLSPAAFIPLAEETGLIGELDRWVFNHALDDASAWTRGPDAPLDWVSINISPQSVEGDLQSWCREKISGAELPKGALHLEITERWALREDAPLQPLRDEGVRLSIDDFGTGYSSLRYLRSLNADVLKIDSEFIQDLGRDEKTTAIVQFLMNLSLRLDVEVIAEGVETAEQETILRELGCAMAQGYHFSRPVPGDTIADRARSTSGEPLSGKEAPFPS